MNAELTLKRNKDGTWKLTSGKRSLTVTCHTGNPLDALASFYGNAHWPLVCAMQGRAESFYQHLTGESPGTSPRKLSQFPAAREF
jgi:hypothetical protein